MLPRWTDTARLRLSPAGFALALTHRGIHRRVALRTGTTDPGSEGLLAATRRELAALPSHTPVHIELSSHLVRYALLDFSSQVVGDDALRTVARQAFRHMHGAVAGAWAISVSAAGFGTRIAAAVDESLKQGIIDTACSVGVCLTGIDPLLMSGFNAARPHLLPTGWFAVVEPGRVVVVRTVDGDWKRVVSSRCGVDWRLAIQLLVRRETPWVDSDDDNFCQVAEFAAQASDPRMAPVMHVISIAGDLQREAA